MGNGILTRSNPGGGAERVGDIRLSTRTSLGEKWVLANGAVDPRYNGSTDIATVSSDSEHILITNTDAWSDDGLPKEMLISDKKGNWTNIFYMGNNEYWRLFGYYDYENDAYILEVHKYNYVTKDYVVESVDTNLGFGSDWFLESMVTDNPWSINNGNYISDIVATSDYSGFAAYSEYDHFKEFTIFSRDCQPVQRFIVYTDENDRCLLTEDELAYGIQEVNVFGGPDINNVYWRVVFGIDDDDNHRRIKIFKNDQLIDDSLYDGDYPYYARSFCINNSVYLLTCESISDSDISLYELTSNGLNCIEMFSGTDVYQYMIYSFPHDNNCIMLMGDNENCMIYNVQENSTNPISSMAEYDDRSRMTGMSFNGIIYDTIMISSVYALYYWNADFPDNSVDPDTPGYFNGTEEVEAGTAPGLYIGNIINTRDEINNTGIILTDYIPEGATNAMCARSASGNSAPKLPNISVDNCYAFIKIKE